jgi:hypothetical protein
MKKRHLKSIALLGLASGLVISSQATLQAENHTIKTIQQILAQMPSSSTDSYTSTDSSADQSKNDPNSQNEGYHLMTEKELLLELNDEGTKLYNGLDAEGKELARYVASQRCQATNKCKGLNACKTEHNDCAGQGSCQGKGKCAFSDKNQAVKVVAKKMAEKRNAAQ